MAQSVELPGNVEAALGRWAAAAGCRLLIVFGSSAAGRARPRSDVDLAIAFDAVPEPERRLRMIGELQDLCGRPVDVVFLRDETSPILRFEIFRGGRPFYEAEPGLFVTEAVRALALYEDALPFRRRLIRHASRTGDVAS